MKQLTLNDVRSMSKEEAIETLEYIINTDYILNFPIIEIPNFISDSDCDYISETIKKYMDKNPSKIFNSTVRMGKSLTISKIPELEEIENYLYEFFSKKIYEEILNKSLYYRTFIMESDGQICDNGYDFHHYNDSDHCIRHYDQHFHDPGRDRDGRLLLERVFIFASCSLCLNTPQTGGEIIFPFLQKKIKSEKGKVVIWSPHPFYEHYTNPTENDYRDVIVTWMQYANKVTIDSDYYATLLKKVQKVN